MILDVRVDRIRLPGGQVAQREVVRHPGAVGVVALEDDKVLLVRQNRHAVGRNLLEIPAGKLDREDEDPLDCALRELREETGFTSNSPLEEIVTYFSSPGFTDEVIHLFLATSVRRIGEPPAHDEGEPIELEWMSLESALTGIGSEIVDAKTIVGLLLAARRR